MQLFPLASRRLAAGVTLAFATCSPATLASPVVTQPYEGITYIVDTETVPRNVTMHIAEIDLTAPGIAFALSPPSGTLEATRQTTTSYLNQTHAQLAINAEFFLPFPSADLNANVIGLAASNGNVYSGFEAPVQSYALVTDAPAIDIGPGNQASIVHANTADPTGKSVVENVTLDNAFAGSAQIITNGAVSIPQYKDATHPNGQLTPPGPANYSNSNSWYNLINARTVAGLTQDDKTLVVFTVDNAGGSHGMSLTEVANLLLTQYGIYNAINLDGGGSTSFAMENPVTGIDQLMNVSSDNPNGRAVANSLAVFADPVPEPASIALLLGGLGMLAGSGRRRRQVY